MKSTSKWLRPARRLRERRRIMPGAPAAACAVLTAWDRFGGIPGTSPSIRLTSTAVLRAESSLKSAQMLQKLTGATHAAAWVQP